MLSGRWKKRARCSACRNVGLRSPCSQASTRSGLTCRVLATCSDRQPPSVRAQASTLGLTGANSMVDMARLGSGQGSYGLVRSSEGFGQDGLPQRLRAFQVRVDLGFDFADDGEAAVDFGDDAVLLIIGRDRDR